MENDEMMLKPTFDMQKVKSEIEAQYSTEIVQITVISDSCYDRQTFVALEWNRNEYSIRNYYRFLNLYNGKKQNYGQGSGFYLFHGIKNNKDEGLSKATETFKSEVERRN